jgi:hypothetical protein
VAAARVTAADSTAIAYERAGDGPAVILVGGGLDDGAENAPLLEELSGFTVVNYAAGPGFEWRRGGVRGRARGGGHRRADRRGRRPGAPVRRVVGRRAGAGGGTARAPRAAATPAPPARPRSPRRGLPPRRCAAPAGADPGGFLGPAADALVATLPHTERRMLAGEGHVAAPAVLAQALAEFFAA